MSQAAEISAPSRDHNNPPELLPVEDIITALRGEHFDVLKRMDELKAKFATAPEKIETEEVAKDASDLLKASKKARAAAEAMRKEEIEPYDTRKKAIDALFKNPWKALKEAEDELNSAMTAYATAKADAARIEAERKAEEARLEQERLEAEAREAERKRQAAEMKRLEEERRAAAAQAERERAAEAARQEEERARQAKEEAARIERERKQRDAEEAQRREEEEARQAKQAEHNRLEQIRREREERERQEDLERQREAEETKLAQLRKEREEAEANAKANRETAKEKLGERREAEDTARDLKADERAAKTDARTWQGQAERTGKVATKHEKQASGSTADLSRSRSDLGTIATVSGRWKVTVTDYDALPIDLLRPHIARDALDAAAFRYMQSLTDTDKKANNVPGIDFEYDEATRVL